MDPRQPSPRRRRHSECRRDGTREKTVDRANAPVAADFAMHYQPHRQGRDVEHRQQRLDLRVRAQHVVGDEADPEPGTLGSEG